jgi:hypothetical protein
VERQQLREYLEELNSTIGDLHAPDDDKNKLTGLIAEIELQLNEPCWWQAILKPWSIKLRIWSPLLSKITLE